MPTGLASAHLTAGEYLAWERAQSERHEFFRGEVFAMAGGSLRHSALAAAFAGELRAAARGSDCMVHSSDQRVVLRSGEHCVYPDVTLVCGAHELVEGSSDLLTNPCAIVEVLSRSTEAYDRGDKWAAYRQLASLREYVLVSQAQARIEIYRREGEGWRYEVFEAGVVEAGGRLTIAGFELSVDATYAGVLALPAE